MAPTRQATHNVTRRKFEVCSAVIGQSLVGSVVRVHSRSESRPPYPRLLSWNVGKPRSVTVPCGDEKRPITDTIVIS